MANEIAHKTAQQGEIILYQPDETVRIEVRLEDDTVWLTQAQMAELFQKDQSVIARHIGNVFREGELNESSNMQILHNTLSKYKPTKVYSLNVIISVGYRVKSKRGTQFRIWATAILRELLLRGYAVSQQTRFLKEDIDNRLLKHEKRIEAIEEKIDFFVRTNQPPVEGIFYDGQIFDAYRFVSELIRKAKHRIILIDNYVDETVLTQLDKRTDGVTATIYTQHVSQQLQLDIDRHNAQYSPIIVEHFNRAHDRFLLIDDEVYHIGASLKDLGRKWFAFTLMHDITAAELISRIGGSATVNIE
jgi:hypothetical protein